MNLAIVIAGGSGTRMGLDIPKQFVNIYDKPVIIYTLEGFERHPMIDEIEVVCIDGWHDVLKAYARQFGITKLKRVIVTCRKYGNAVTSMPYNEQIFVVDDELSTVKYIPRETIRRVATPQAYKFGKLDKAYHEAFEKKIGIYGSSYTNTMMADLGERLYFAAGSDKNIKLTTRDDLELFKAYLKTEGGGGNKQ